MYNGCRIKALPLEGLERLTIDGTEYEALNTSGGVATMCETFEGGVGDLNYKTIRYTGHRDLIRFLLRDLNLGRRLFSTHWGHTVYDPACEKNTSSPPDCNH